MVVVARMTTTLKGMCATSRKIPVQYCHTMNVIGLFLDYYCNYYSSCYYYYCIDLCVVVVVAVEGC